MELLESTPARKKSFNIKKEIRKYLKKWYWFALSLLLFLAAAKIYLRYAQKTYVSKTSLKFQQSKSGGGSSSALSDLKNLGMGVSGNDELQTETAVIVSKPILEKVVNQLGLNAKLYSVGNVKDSELYEAAPFDIKNLKVDSLKLNQTFAYTISPVGKASFQLSGLKGSYRFGVPYNFPFGFSQFNLKPGKTLGGSLRLVIVPVKQIVSSLEGQISAQIPQGKGNMMELSMVGTIPERSQDILNELTRQYNIDGVLDKNLEAQYTQNFIANRLEIISEDLLGVENQKEGFKRSNEITDLETQAQLSLQNASDNTRQIVDYTSQLDLVNSLYSAAAAGGDRLLPSNLGLSAATEQMISQYNDLLLTRNKTLKQATNENPAVIEMNKEITSLKSIIRKNLSDTRNNLSQNIARLQGMVSSDKAKISKFPSQEKMSRTIERELNLKEQLYLYLLQKREENAITLAVTAPKAKVINPAYTAGIVSPNAKQIYMGAAAIGFLLPLLALYGFHSLDTRVHNREDITERVSNISVIGEIPLKEEGEALVGKSDFSVFAESFRILVSNLKFFLKARKISHGKIVLFTSTVKGEGKTTISVNTALTVAGKSKVLLIGADIRNPQLHRFFPKEEKGLTDYLIADNVPIQQFIVPSKLNNNLDLLFSGEIAPNPNELFDMEKFEELLRDLREIYDYIIIDSAPVMLVSDTLNIIDKTDLLLYVVKAEYTEKEMMDFAENFKNENKIKNIAFVLNSVRPEFSRYGQKYAYGYYNTK